MRRGKDTVQRRGSFNDPIFRADYDIYTGPSRLEAIRSWSKRCGFKPGDFSEEEVGSGTLASFCLHSEWKGGMFWFREPSPGGGTVSHEAVHACMRMARDLGLDKVHEENEFLAYYTDWLVRQIGKVVWTKQRK